MTTNFTTEHIVVDYAAMEQFVTSVFESYAVPEQRAQRSAAALLYGDLTGMNSHGIANLVRLYLPMFDEGRVSATAELDVVSDSGACLVVDANKTLGLWAASDALELASRRARQYGSGFVFARNATHFGCAGYHTKMHADRGDIALLASNCGGQRIARPPGGKYAMLGTNPLSIASPAGEGSAPFVLDMSTTAVPTGRVRQAARRGQPIPPGWLEDADGRAVTDPEALDAGTGYPLWLGGRPETGAYKGYGLALAVETLAAVLPGASTGPSVNAYAGGGEPTGRDDDIGFVAMVLDPNVIRGNDSYESDASAMFDAIVGCQPLDPRSPVSYPGARENAELERSMSEGIRLETGVVRDLRSTAADRGIELPGALR